MNDADELVRKAVDPTVQHAVVHILDHRVQDGLTLSDEELDFDGNEPLRKYFSDQVSKALKDAQTGAACFSPDGEQDVIRECRRILDDGTQLVPSSKILARQLFTAMRVDRRIKPGSLAVCLYTASNYPKKIFLALIKLDPMKVFVQKVEPRNGKKVVSYEQRGNVMPTKGEKLQKAAIIPPVGTSKNFDLLLLDRQVVSLAADFFADTFLNTYPALDPTEATENLFYAVQDAYNRLVIAPPAHPAHISPEEADALQQHIQTALQTPVVNLDEWVAALPLKEEAKVVITEEISNRLPGQGQVLIDQQHAHDKLLKKKRFRGGHGVVFEVEFDHYDDVVKKPVIEKTLPNGKVVTVMTIEVPELQWVRK
jgi:37-kD nucleoid-associated bacterial protein